MLWSLGLQKDYYSHIDEYCLTLQVPLLNETTFDSIPNNTLVRYVGMVQDMFNPEYFVSEFKDSSGNWQTTRYGDIMDDFVNDSCEKQFDERYPVFMVPIPGRTEWLSGKYNDLASSSIQALQTVQGKSTGMKRQIDDVQMCPEEDICGKQGQIAEAAADNSHANKKAPTNEDSKSDKPLVEKKNIPYGSCVLHLYEGIHGLKLNDVVEVMGVISRVPDLVSQAMMEEDEQDALASRIPTSMAPRIHAISVKKLQSLLPENMPQVQETSEVQQARSQVIDFLSSVLGGDVLAAEYLLMLLISRVHMRIQDSDATALGSLALNLTGAPDKSADFVQALESAISGLMPSLASLPLDIGLLNKKAWYPCKSQNQCFLPDAILQLPSGSVIMLDETAMTAGQLTEIGLKNLGAIQNMMQHQKLPYDFQFYQLDQPTDQPILIISTGRTMLKGAGEMQIPLCPAAAPLPGKQMVSEMLIQGNPDLARAYLATVRRVSLIIPKDLEKVIEHDMTEARKKDAANINAEVFHQWMNLARLFCLSHGETEMSLERWRQVMQMEGQRLQRCAAATGAKP